MYKLSEAMVTCAGGVPRFLLFLACFLQRRWFKDRWLCKLITLALAWA